jgi:hypothetical protein
LPQIAIWLPTQLPRFGIFAGAYLNTDLLPKSGMRWFFVFKSLQSTSTVLALVSEVVSTKSKGIGNDHTVRFRKAGTHQLATERTRLSPEKNPPPVS